MVRTKTYTYNRPESTPNLAFERFKEEGNSEEAVVYFPEEGLLQYNKTKQYFNTSQEIPDEMMMKIKEVFLPTNFNLLIVKYTDNNNDGDEIQLVCSPVVVPDKEQKVKITSLLQSAGSKMAEEVNTIQECIKRIKTHAGTLNSEVLAIVPGFDLEKLLLPGEDAGAGAEFDLPLKEQNPELDALECVCMTVLEEYKALAVAEPFSKKRKASADAAEDE